MLDRHQFAIELVTETFFFCHWTRLQGTDDIRAYNLSYKITHKDFFEKFIEFHGQKSYVENSDIDILLQHAEKKEHRPYGISDKKFAIILASGATITFYGLFELALALHEKDPDVIAIAHIMKRDNEWYQIHQQHIAIDINLWINCGRPKFGNWSRSTGGRFPATSETTDIFPLVIRSKDNVHDDYTPWHIEAQPRWPGGPFTDTETLPTNTKLPLGWNFIKEAISKRYKLINFSRDIRNEKNYIYPEDCTTEDFNNVEKDIIKDENTDMMGFQKKLYMFNTENYKNVSYLHRTDNIDIKNIKSYAILPSGFKGNFILESLNYTNEDLAFYDINPNALTFKKILIDTWNGKNFPNWYKKYFYKNNVLRLFISPTEATKDGGEIEMDVISELWKEEVERWNGERNFSAHWKKLQKNKDRIRYCCIDIINDISKLQQLLKMLTPDTLIWTSNVWTSKQALSDANYDLEVAHVNSQKWITSLTEQVYVYGNIRFPHKNDDDLIISKAGKIIVEET